MALLQTTLTLFVVATTALEVEACVCYVGQEFRRDTGKRYGWSLAEKKPCECTVFRLGGVNMKPQIKPYEVTIGDDPRVSINKQGEIRPSLNCNDGNDVSTATGERPSPCQNYTTGPSQERLFRPEPLTLPIRLEFIVRGNEVVHVMFCADELAYNKASFAVSLRTSGFRIEKREANLDWTHVLIKQDLTIFGEPFIVTYNNGHIEAGLKGVQESLLTYDLTSPPHATTWFVILQSKTKTNWSLYEPCITNSNRL